jgi:hypothetical protein
MRSKCLKGIHSFILKKATNLSFCGRRMEVPVATVSVKKGAGHAPFPSAEQYLDLLNG